MSPNQVGAAQETKGAKSSQEEDDKEVRTLWVDYDEHGERFKRWRDVCCESYAPAFEEKPLEGPCTAPHTIKHERHGGDPRLWLQLWMRSNHIESGDRTYHEMKVLVDSLYFAGTFDQVNIPALMAMEVICLRIQAIVDAYTAIRHGRAGRMLRFWLVKGPLRILCLLPSGPMPRRRTRKNSS